MGLPGQLAPKPISVWLVQGLLVLGAAFMVIVLATQQEKFAENASRAVTIGANAMVLFTISVQVGLLVGTQLRQQWARWLTAGLLTLASIVNLLSLLGNRGAELAGNLIGAGLFFLLMARFAFGAPSRRYFGREAIPYQ